MSIDQELNNLNNQINSLEDTKEEIRTAINEKGVDVPQSASFRSYANSIRQITSGGGLPLLFIGNAVAIDETLGLDYYLNGQVLTINDNLLTAVNKLKAIANTNPSIFCTEEEWQAQKTLSHKGQVGRFVLDEDNHTLRLPAIVNIQGIFDLQNLGLTVDAGLPNITGEIRANLVVADHRGALKIRTGTYGVGNGIQGIGDVSNSLFLNAQDSNSIYGNSDTVQEEAIQYPYFIHLADKATTSIDIHNEIELNNPYSFGDSKYSQIEIENISWLRSNGQWNAKSLYPDYYDWILTNINDNKDLFKLSTDTYDDYDWVLNTSTQEFRLPLKTHLASGNAVIGNGMAVGLTNGSNNAGLVIYNEQYGSYLGGMYNCYGAPVSSSGSGGAHFPNTSIVGITTDAEKSGIETCSQNLYLYFFVGESIENPNLINIPGITNSLATKVNMEQAAKAGMPSDRLVQLTLGESGTEYTAPADGYFMINVMVPGVQGAYNHLVMKNITSDAPVLTQNVSGAYFNISNWMPVRKDDIVRIDYYTSFQTVDFQFAYAEGAE